MDIALNSRQHTWHRRKSAMKIWMPITARAPSLDLVMAHHLSSRVLKSSGYLLPAVSSHNPRHLNSVKNFSFHEISDSRNCVLY
ncbi:hypothetical protein Pfo_023502 [Paulownia fortunei]|nr:hypothetical protein Pfo_023502 [Paulownia fortunei]